MVTECTVPGWESGVDMGSLVLLPTRVAVPKRYTRSLYKKPNVAIGVVDVLYLGWEVV